jgi:hypothetical protein
MLAVHVPLPYFKVVPPNPLKADAGLYYENYVGILVLSNQYFDFMGLHLQRLALVFDEPGVVGTLSALLLVANLHVKGSRKERWILILVGALSLSFAFYMLVSIYMALKAIFNKERARSAIVILLIISFVVAVNYSSLQSIPFLGRMVFSSDQFLSDNRISDAAKGEFYSQCADLSSCLFGRGYGVSREIDAGGSSVIFYIVDYGWLIVLSWLFVVIMFARKYRNYRQIFSAKYLPVYAVLVASTYQRPMLFSFLFLLLLVPILLDENAERSTYLLENSGPDPGWSDRQGNTLR